MTRPISEVVASVDALVAQFDHESYGEPLDGRAMTSSYAVIVAVWERLAALVEKLDAAVADPLADGAAEALTLGAALDDRDVHRLAFWLPHVGAALSRRR